MGSMSGGQSYCELFPIDSTHTTVTTTAYITLANQVKTTIGKDALTLDTVQCDKNTIQLLEDAAAAGGSSSNTAEVVVNEKGVETSAGAAAAGGQQYLAIVYGGVDGSEIEIITYIGTISEDSSDRDLENKKLTRPKFILNAVAALLDVTIPNACLQTATPALAVAPGTPKTHPSGRKRKTNFVTAGADV